MRQRDAAVAPRHAVGQNTIQKGLSVGAGHVVFGKAREVDDPYPLTHGLAFMTHHLEYIIAAVTVIFFTTVQREPLRPFPAKGLGVHRALGFQGVVKWRQSTVARRGEFFTGQGRGIGQTIILEALGVHIGAICKVTEAPRIKARHVYFRVTVDHPLGEVLATARTLGNPEGRAAAEPEVLDARDRPQQRRPVG